MTGWIVRDWVGERLRRRLFSTPAGRQIAHFLMTSGDDE